MPVLSANDLVRSFGPRPVLDHVSLALEPGQRVGLIGSNGSGKSTLAKILAGVEPPDGGTVARQRDLVVAYLAQEPVLDLNATAFAEVESGLVQWRATRARLDEVNDALSHGATNALLDEQSTLTHKLEQLGGWDQSHRVRSMLEHLGIARPEQSVGTMSGGEKRRVALAKLLLSAPGLAILDEPTNHLDAETAEWLEEYLVDQFPGAVLLITHDRYFLDRVVTRVFELDRGALSAFEGNYERYLELKAERLEHESRVEANRLNVLRRERDWLSRSAPARTSKQKARINRAADLEDTVRTARRASTNTTFEISGVKTGKKILELKNVTKRFGDRTLFENVSLTLTPGERVGIIGRNGTGKTTLAKVALGLEPPTSGEIVVGPNTRVMYFDQQRAGLRDDETVLENVYEGSDKVRLGETYVNIHSYLERFLFDGTKQHQAVATLSGGERARLALAKMLRGGANLVVLDEPTNDLDLLTLSTLEELLTSFDGCALVITHDRYFLNRTATSILAFEQGGKVTPYAGNFDDYLVQREYSRAERSARERSERDARPSNAPSATAAEKKPRKGLTMGEEKELAALPDKIDAAEKNLAAMEAALGDPELYAKRGNEVAALTAKRDDAQRAVEALMTRWEELERKKT